MMEYLAMLMDISSVVVLMLYEFIEFIEFIQNIKLLDVLMYLYLMHSHLSVTGCW